VLRKLHAARFLLFDHIGFILESLDGISDDELAKGNPDITDLVLSAKTGWPSRISRQFTNGKPTPQQKQKAQSGLNAVFGRYCPGKQVPILPQPK
jgi:hypothetical protein